MIHLGPHNLARSSDPNAPPTSGPDARPTAATLGAAKTLAVAKSAGASTPGLRALSAVQAQTKALGKTVADDTPVLLVLLRHGESTWNHENRFTGWTDVPLTKTGEAQARFAGAQLRDLRIDRAFTSDLSRAQKTLDLVLEAAGQRGVPIARSAALNERHYGVLQGLDKKGAEKTFAPHELHRWRRTWDGRPPGGESLADTAARVVPYFNGEIAKALAAGENVLVVAHGNSLRALVKELDGSSREAVEGLSIANAAPLVYTLQADGSLRRANAEAAHTAAAA